MITAIAVLPTERDLLETRRLAQSLELLQLGEAGSLHLAGDEEVRNMTRTIWLSALAFFAAVMVACAPASAQEKPNIVFIMGDDIGWANVGAYNQGIMAGRTPHLDQLASEGMRYTDYYAEASCTAGRANFITGELPMRTGLTTVGQAGSPLGMPDEAPTIATVLKSMGYATGQFGKNHLGDRNQFLPTVHGFDEFYGYLYHLDAMEDPCHANYPPELKVIDQARSDGKPFFLWLNPTRMHVVTHLSEKYEKMRTPANGWSTEEAGMAQLDDIVGSVIKKVKDLGIEGDTILAFSTDNGAENLTWPDGGQTPFAGGKGTGLEGGIRAPMIIRWPGKVPAGKVENSIVSGLDWFPTFVAAAGNPDIADQLKQGKQLGDRNYKVHLDGYNQTDLITGKGPSKRNEIWYFTESTLAAARIGDFKYRFTDQPNGWFGPTEKVDWPIITNLRLDLRAYRAESIHQLRQLVHVPILAWRVCAAGSGKTRPDRHRLPADAEGRELQP
jgi:arylsulfatase A-like enzyme